MTNTPTQPTTPRSEATPTTPTAPHQPGGEPDQLTANELQNTSPQQRKRFLGFLRRPIGNALSGLGRRIGGEDWQGGKSAPTQERGQDNISAKLSELKSNEGVRFIAQDKDNFGVKKHNWAFKYKDGSFYVDSGTGTTKLGEEELLQILQRSKSGNLKKWLENAQPESREETPVPVADTSPVDTPPTTHQQAEDPVSDHSPAVPVSAEATVDPDSSSLGELNDQEKVNIGKVFSYIQSQLRHNGNFKLQIPSGELLITDVTDTQIKYTLTSGSTFSYSRNLFEKEYKQRLLDLYNKLVSEGEQQSVDETEGVEGASSVPDDPDAEADLDATDETGDQDPGEDTPENPQTLQVEPDPESQPNTPPNSPLLEINWDGAQTVETQTPEMQLTFLNYFNEIISNRDVKGGYGVEGSVKPPAQVLSELFNLFVSDGNIQPVEASLLQSIRSTIETQYIDHIATSSDQHSRVRVEEMLNPYLSPAELGKNICQLSVYLDGEQLENVLGGVRDRITSLSNGLEGEIKEAEKKQSEAAERKGFEQDLLDVYSEIVGDDFQQKSSLMYNLEPKLVYENGKYKPPEDSILDGIEYDILTRLYRGSNANLSKYSNEQIRTLTEKLKQYKEEQGS